MRIELNHLYSHDMGSIVFPNQSCKLGSITRGSKLLLESCTDLPLPSVDIAGLYLKPECSKKLDSISFKMLV